MSTLNSNNERLAQLMQQVHDLPPVAHEDAVLRIPQELTDTQKWQARSNIGAASAEEVAGKMDKVTGTPDQVVGFDEAGNPVAREAPSGGSSSWNDLTDKPVVAVGGDTLTWDGDMTGRIYVDIGGAFFVHVSDACPQVDTENGNFGDFSKGGSVSLAMGEDITALPFFTDNLLLAENGSVLFDALAFACVREDGTDIDGFTFPAKGTYFLYQPPEVDGGSAAFATALTVNGYTGFIKEYIDPNYLPAIPNRLLPQTIILYASDNDKYLRNYETGVIPTRANLEEYIANGNPIFVYDNHAYCSVYAVQVRSGYAYATVYYNYVDLAGGTQVLHGHTAEYTG